jgi:hypothetical protein
MMRNGPYDARAVTWQTQSLNRYAYALNNPETLADPSGLTSCTPQNYECGQNACSNLQYGQGKGQCLNGVNGVIAANTELGPTGWDPFEFTGFWDCPNGDCSYYDDLPAAIFADTLQVGTTPLPEAPSPTQSPKPTTSPQTPAQAAAQYCQQHGQLSFNIPFTKVLATLSASGTFGPINYSSTNDLNTILPVFPWPEWLAGGASVDLTFNAPSDPRANPVVGFGKNLSLGYFMGANGPQGISLSLGPSVGPPINISVPTANGCAIAAGGS